jgi:murein DD-endopeptidase MepM/ murein hydrolase activator NlpD
MVRWLGAIVALGVVDAVFLTFVHARPGRTAVVVWWVMPVAIALATAALLAVALIRTVRRRDLPNRRQLAGFAILGLVIASLVTFRTYPSSHDDRPSRVAFRLPLEGPVTVAWGGPTLEVNYHVVMPDQRWAYDLLVTVDDRTFQGTGDRLEDYYAYGRSVHAPAAGIVRAAHDGEPDGPIGHWQVRRAMGNHVVLEVAPSQFLFIAHLQPGSVAVKIGDYVEAGQMLGRVGNSGNSSEPHVHLHLQDALTTYFAEGIPLYFSTYRRAGVDIPRGMPTGGRERKSRSWPGAFTGEIVVTAE